MSEEIEKTVAEALKHLMSWAEAAGVVGKQEVPQLLNELIQYSFWESVAHCLFVILAVCAWLKWVLPVLTKFSVAIKEGSETGVDVVGVFLGSASSAIGGIASIIFIFKDVNTIIKTTVAPRLFILEWLRGLV